MDNNNSLNCKPDKEAEFNLRKYHVDYDTGFMLKNPLKALPPYFEPWNELTSSLTVWIKEKTFRDAVDKLPLLDHSKLVGYRQLRLAHLQLCFITTGYIWQNGDKGVAKVLPRCLAIPFFKISELLGHMPILCHADLILANWSLIDLNGAFTLDNMECVYHMPCGSPGDWFCTVTIMVELSFAKCLKSLERIVNLLGFSKELEVRDPGAHGEEAEAEIALCLQDVNEAISAMQNSISKMRVYIPAKLFFNEIRPFLSGWGGESSPLPDGLIYEGVSDTPIKMTGGSAAQSSTLQVLDALLGVKHKQDRKVFLVRMRDFMPPDHKRLIEDLEQLPYTLRDLVTASRNVILKSSYNKSLSLLSDLRDYHLNMVKMYIIIPSRKNNEGNYESINKQGTGGTDLIPFLRDVWSDTKGKLLPEKQQSSNVSEKSQNFAGLTVNVLLAALAVLTVGFAAKFSDWIMCKW